MERNYKPAMELLKGDAERFSKIDVAKYQLSPPMQPLASSSLSTANVMKKRQTKYAAKAIAYTKKALAQMDIAYVEDGLTVLEFQIVPPGTERSAINQVWFMSHKYKRKMWFHQANVFTSESELLGVVRLQVPLICRNERAVFEGAVSDVWHLGEQIVQASV